LRHSVVPVEEMVCDIALIAMTLSDLGKSLGMGFEVCDRGLEFKVYVLGFGFGVYGSGFRVHGLGLRLALDVMCDSVSQCITLFLYKYHDLITLSDLEGHFCCL